MPRAVSVLQLLQGPNLFSIYKCTLCDEGDFDLCLKCFEMGIHCHNQTHLLIEVTVDGNFPITTQCYSSADSLGLRSVTKD